MQLLALVGPLRGLPLSAETESVEEPIRAPPPIPEPINTIKVVCCSYKIAKDIKHPLLEDPFNPEATVDITFLTDGSPVAAEWIDAIDKLTRFELGLKDGTVIFDAYCEACEYLVHYNEHWLVKATLLITGGTIVRSVAD